MSRTQTTVIVFVTKYALTRGVQQVEVEISGRYAYGTNKYRTQYPPGHWHRSEAEANKRADEMRLAKIASLEKQIAKLRKFGGGR